MERNLTTFFYLKTLKKIEHTNFELSHTLFHLQRFLFLEENIKWPRLFLLQNSGTHFVDWSGGLSVKLLVHHDLIQMNQNSNKPFLNEKGNTYLQSLEQELFDINSIVESFFSQYNGETVYTNSCMAKSERRFIACHLCENPTCIQEESLFAGLKSASNSLFKNPYRSYSKLVAN
ncbi:hypothetical protein CN918_32700 [Priestia megaterium]|nr:hypothetical protein CN918_32700 [Priestia megaterium]